MVCLLPAVILAIIDPVLEQEEIFTVTTAEKVQQEITGWVMGILMVVGEESEYSRTAMGF